jgi:hypothetical protein
MSALPPASPATSVTDKTEQLSKTKALESGTIAQERFDRMTRGVLAS